MEALPEEILVLEKEAVVHWLPCGKGKMPIRQWAKPGAEKVVLLHGGSGSWLHWARNIPALREQFDVYAIDLPGLGDAAMCEVESDAFSAARATKIALEQLLDSAFHVVAFSWGCTITAMIMKDMTRRLKSVMLTGPAAVGGLPEFSWWCDRQSKPPQFAQSQACTCGVRRETTSKGGRDDG